MEPVARQADHGPSLCRGAKACFGIDICSLLVDRIYARVTEPEGTKPEKAGGDVRDQCMGIRPN